MNWYMGADSNGKPNGWSEEPSPGYIEVSQEIRDLHELNPNWVWNGVTLVAPAIPEPEPQPPCVPQIISMRQCQLYLYYKELLDAVNQTVLGMSTPAQIEWNTSAEVWRSSPMVELLRVQFEWTVEQMDSMFIEAVEL